MTAQVDGLAHIDLQQGVLERLDGTRHVTLDDEVEGVDLAVLEGLVEVLEADALATLGELSRTLRCRTLLGDLTRGAVVVGYEERVACSRYGREADDEHRSRRRRLVT